MEVSTGGLDLKLVTEASYGTDNIKETIISYSDNFTKLEKALKESVTAPSLIPLGQEYDTGVIFWNGAPSTGSYIGWVNTLKGLQVNPWQPKTEVKIGDKVKSIPTNGNYYTCISEGRTVALQPVFYVGAGVEFSDASSAVLWKPNYNYEVNDIVVQTDGSKIFYYICETAGYTNSVEPSWTITPIGSTLIDGSVVWRKEKAVIWKQAGNTAEFRPFGKID